MEEELEKTSWASPSAKILTCLLEKVLKLNNFTFNGENFIQVKGTAMGTRAAPNFANIYMGRLEDKFVYQIDWSRYIIDWVCFIDDIFLIWKGTMDSLTTFIGYLNSVVPSIKFTHEISSDSLNLLSGHYNNQGCKWSHQYGRVPETHRYAPICLHWTSAHPPHLKHSISYSQALRLRRICSLTDILEQRIMEYSNYFVTCGYKRYKVLTEMRKVMSLTQEESLRTRERETISRIPLVTTYNPHTMFIAGVANRHWDFLQSKERLAHIFRERPLIAYRRPKSLRDALVSTTLKRKTPDNCSSISRGCGPCNIPWCSWCNHVNKASTFAGIKN